MEWVVVSLMAIVFIAGTIYFEFYVMKEKVKNVERGILLYIFTLIFIMVGSTYMLFQNS